MKSTDPKRRKKARKPACVVTVAHISIPIFKIEKQVKGRDYSQFEFCYYPIPGQRERVRRADQDSAKQEAERVATKLANGEAKVLELNTHDLAVYVQSLDLLKPLGLALNLAVSEYVSAVNRLPKGSTLTEAVDFFARRHPANMPERTVKEVVDEMVEAKRKAGRDETTTIKDLRSRGGAFAEFFKRPIREINGGMIEEYLDQLENGDGEPVAARTVRNHVQHITSLFKWSVRRKYLSREAEEELEVFELPDCADGEVQIFTPSELQEMLEAARPEIVPWLCIAAFSGVRSAEIQRLQWGEVNLAERHIEILARKAKTRSRRLAPIPENAVAWLSDHLKSEGRLSAFDNMPKQLLTLVQDINAARQARAAKDGTTFEPFVWKRNGLRHSFISYRVAQTGDVDRTALEAGNSPNMIFKNYRKVVTESEAAKWFGVVPPAQVANVVPMREAVAVSA